MVSSCVLAMALVVTLVTTQVPWVQGQESPREQHQDASILERGPWPTRRRAGIIVAAEGQQELRFGELSVRRLRGLGLRGGVRTEVDIDRWPSEPPSPSAVNSVLFERAFVQLCPPDVEDAQVRLYARAALRAAAEFGVDPFMLAALSSHQSGCRADTEDSWGIGLARVNLGLHRLYIHRNAYHYSLRRGRRDSAVVLFNDARRLTRMNLLHSLLNLRATAAFLQMFRHVCPSKDSLFHSVPHRHPVSHVIYGDHVRSAFPESLILTERRRILSYYHQEAHAAGAPTYANALRRCSNLRCNAATSSEAALSTSFAKQPSEHDKWRFRFWRPISEPKAQIGLLALSSPLDGTPRLVTGLLGDTREQGHRTHNGIDLPAALGEPVRAVAEGVVAFAGVELRQRGMVSLSPCHGGRVPQGRIGPRGVHVRVEHQGGISSLYVHLHEVFVGAGERVKRGQLIGTVGLVGVHTSGAHLHFGLFDGETVLDPMRHLAPYVLANPVPESPQPRRFARVGRHAP